jgi:hypothetical protein
VSFIAFVLSGIAGPASAKGDVPRPGRGRPRRRRGARFRGGLPAAAEVADAAPATALRPEGPCRAKVRRCPDCPNSAVRAVPPRLLLLCLLLRSSWLTVERGRHGAGGVVHRRGGGAALAVSVSVGWRRSNSNSRRLVASFRVLRWMRWSRAGGEIGHPKRQRLRSSRASTGRARLPITRENLRLMGPPDVTVEDPCQHAADVNSRRGVITR